MRLKLTLLSVAGNMIGALLTFLYFAYINVRAYQYVEDELSFHYIIYFIIGTGIIFLIVILFTNRWTRYLNQVTEKKVALDELDADTAQQLRRKALHYVPVMTASSLFGWLMAGGR